MFTFKYNALNYGVFSEKMKGHETVIVCMIFAVLCSQYSCEESSRIWQCQRYCKLLKLLRSSGTRPNNNILSVGKRYVIDSSPWQHDAINDDDGILSRLVNADVGVQNKLDDVSFNDVKKGDLVDDEAGERKEFLRKRLSQMLRRSYVINADDITLQKKESDISNKEVEEERKGTYRYWKEECQNTPYGNCFI